MCFFLNASIEEIIISQFVILSIVPICFFLYFFTKRYKERKANKNLIVTFKNIKKADILSLSIFIMIFMVNTLHNKFGIMFLNKYSTLVEVAIYIAAFKFINPVFFIQSSLISAFMPKFVHDKELSFDYKLFLTFAIPGLLFP
jgi:O-antigen/teichoic acid export membrane protein